MLLKKKLLNSLLRLTLFVSSIAVITATFYYLLGSFFEPKNIKLHLENIDCAREDEIKPYIKISSINLFDENDEVEQRIKSKFSCIKSVKITSNYINKVFDINISGRVPKAILDIVSEATPSSSTAILKKGDYQEGKIIVDEDGILFAKADQLSNLPVIRLVNKTLSIGEYAGLEVQNAMTILEKLSSLHIDVQSKKIIANTFFVSDQERKYYFDLSKDLGEQIASLQLILSEAKINSRPIESVDLRFDKPVIMYTGKINGKR